MDDQREPPRESPRQIMIVPLIRIGVLRAWALRDHFIRLAIIPLIARMILWPSLVGLIPSLQQGGSDPEQADPAMLMQAVLLGLCYSAVGALFSVNWIRQLTLGTAGAPGFGLRLSMRHLRYFLMLAAISIVVFLPVYMIGVPIFALALRSSAAGMVAAFVMSVLLWLALLARLSPAWIGIAIDARMRLAVAWKRTRGQGFKLLLTMLAVEIGVIFTMQIVSALFQGLGLVAAAPYASLFVALAIDFIGTATMLAILVTAFPHFLRETV